MEIQVCPLNTVESAIAQPANGGPAPSHLMSLLSGDTMIDTPGGIDPDHHLKISVNDIAVPAPGLVAPSHAHAQAIIDFAGRWDRAAPMLIHCYAGISRSTAAALIVLCACEPPGQEASLAGKLRAAAPFARPNPLLISSADAVLGRGGKLTEALLEMGEAKLAWQGELFRLSVTAPV